MIFALASMVFLWFGLAMLWTFALCWAASGPLPKPNFLGCNSDFPHRLDASRWNT